MARWLMILAALAAGLLSSACGSGCCDGEEGAGAGGTPAQQAPTFLLEDVNSTSATYQQLLSPRTQLGRISAWYFGLAG